MGLSLEHLTLLVIVLCGVNSAVGTLMTSTPETFVSGVTANLTLRCEPGDTISDVSNVAVFQLSKNGRLLATAKPDEVILGDGLRTSKYTAVQQIDPDNLGNAFLLFTIRFPEEEDEGEYKCDMNYEDGQHFLKHAECRFTLTQNGTEAGDVQRQVSQALQVVDNLVTRVKALEKQVFNLTQVNTDQAATITNLILKSSSFVGFFASLSDKVTIQENDIITFDKVGFNNGSAYNASSGIFTAPRSGPYLLSVVCEVATAGGVRMEVQVVVGSSPVTKLFIAAADVARGGQQSASLVTYLARGDQVQAQVGNILTENDASVDLLAENLSYFSGYLMG